MTVISRRIPRIPYIPDGISRFDYIPHFNIELTAVTVPGDHAILMLDRNKISKAYRTLRLDDRPRAKSGDFSSFLGRDIDPFVKMRQSGNRMYALAVA